MKATLLVHRRERYGPTAFTEIVVWRLPRRLAGSAHNYKYRLALIDHNQCVPRYDNEDGKGDHRHRGATQENYRFTTIEALLDDFDADTRTTLNEHPNHR